MKAEVIQPLPGSDSITFSRNDALALGNAVVSTAVFGVSPKTSAPTQVKPNGGRHAGGRLAGVTPAKATETVALPISTA
jgi:hypothetical protein